MRKELTGALRQLTRVPDSGQSQAGKLNVVHQLELCVTVFFLWVLVSDSDVCVAAVMSCGGDCGGDNEYVDNTLLTALMLT